MKHTMNFQAVIFDMDGILIDSEPLWKEAEYEIFLELGINIKQQTVPIETTGLRIDEIVAAYAHYYPWEEQSVLQVKDAIIARCIEKIMQTRPFIPEAKAALELCRSLGFKIGLASSSPNRMIKLVLDLFQLTSYFDAYDSADPLVHGKPHPDVYLSVAKMLDVAATQCISIEDSIYGMIAAKAARMKSIVVPTAAAYDDAHWALADIKLHSLSELKKSHLI